jgi:hypothetical protein
MRRLFGLPDQIEYPNGDKHDALSQCFSVMAPQGFRPGPRKLRSHLQADRQQSEKCRILRSDSP